jgi:hypothetical protein
MPDGEVMIPDSSLDGSAKAKLKDNYLEIFKDVSRYSGCRRIR